MLRRWRQRQSIKWAKVDGDLHQIQNVFVGIDAAQSLGAGPELRDHVFRHHQMWVEQHGLVPERLLGREDELRELEAFCAAEDAAGQPRYALWQAEPFAGKSALLAWFVMRSQPANVDIVSYFIAERFANNSRDDFVSTVTDQLAALASSEAPRRAEGWLDRDLPGLYEDAARACVARGRRLLLVADGLDEDGLSGGHSIAALLPKTPPPGMRVVVTSRPNPPVPGDVPEGHPIHNPAILRPLAASPEAGRVRERAGRELKQLLSDKLGNALLGLLAVARGGLTNRDLAELTDVQPHEVDERLGGINGRSFVPDRNGNDFVAGAAESPRRHVLSHQELRQKALEGLGNRAAAEYEALLHAWADGYRAKGWPSGTTPLYLLSDYTRMLRDNGDTKRLSLFVLDPCRQRVLLGLSSVDTALSEVELTRHVIERAAPGDLSLLAALAASRDILSEHAKVLPASIPLAFAQVGEPHRAMELALASPHTASKAIRLAQVARALAHTDPEHATQAARRAARWAQRVRQESIPNSGDDFDAELATGEAAVALIAVGQDRQGRDLLGSLEPHLYEGDPFQCEMAVEASLAARTRSPELAEELLDQAEAYAEDLTVGHLTDPTVPIQAWTVIAAEAGPERVARLYGRIFVYANTYPAGVRAIGVQAAAASALVTAHPVEAAALAQRAGQQLRAALRAQQSLPHHEAHDLSWSLGPLLTNAAKALVSTGRVADAQELVAAVPDTMRTGFYREDVLSGARAAIDGAPPKVKKAVTPAAEALAQQACRLAEQGRRDDAKSRLKEAMKSFAGSPEVAGSPRWLVPLAGALGAIGDREAGEQLAKSLRNHEENLQGREQVRALAAVSISTAAVGRLADARQLAYEAADLARTLKDPYHLIWNEDVFDNGAVSGMDVAAVEAAAQALAHAGERDPALSLANEVGSAEDAARSEKRRRVLVAVAAGLQAHDPDTAAKIIDQERERLLAEKAGSGRLQNRIAQLAKLLVAIGDADRECRQRLRRAVKQMWEEPRSGRPSVEDILVVVVLAARRQREFARRLLEKYERSTESIPPWELPIGGFAIAHALFGELAAAQRSVIDDTDPYHRAEAFAAVAAYLTGTRPDTVPMSDSGFPHTLCSLALLEAPPATEEATDAARGFLADALARDGWYHALPILAHIAPEAVAHVRDIVSTHRSLENNVHPSTPAVSGCHRPQPTPAALVEGSLKPDNRASGIRLA